MLVYGDPQGYPPRLRNPEVMATEAELNPLEACLIQPACGRGKSVSSNGIQFLGNDGETFVVVRITKFHSYIPTQGAAGSVAHGFGAYGYSGFRLTSLSFVGLGRCRTNSHPMRATKTQ